MSRTIRKNKESLFLEELWMYYEGFDLFRIDLITDYLNEFEFYLNRKSEEIEEKIIIGQNSEKENQYSGYIFYEEEFLNYSIYFKRLKLESIFLSSYSSLESFLKSLIKPYQKYFDLIIDIDDLSGRNYIGKSKKYLEKIVGLDLRNGLPQWDKLTKYQWVRNRIVHNDSMTGEQNENFINQMSSLEGLEISKDKIILSDKEFILGFWKTASEYFDVIHSATKIKITTPNNV